MSKIVPLTVYRDGRKVTVGTAEVNDDGTATCHITDGDVAKMVMGDVGALTIVPSHKSRTDVCWACAVQECAQSKDDPSCFCCLNEHKDI